MKTKGNDLLTKREYFAALAMQGFISSNRSGSIKEFVEQSVDVADALIAELNTQAKEPENLDEKYGYKLGIGK